MKIGIISDSHYRSDLQQKAIKKLIEEGAEYILHAGDLCIEDNLIDLKESKLPYVAVFGNNDRNLYSLSQKYNIHKEPYYFKIQELKIKMMHLPLYLSPDSDIVIYGHTHKFDIEYRGNTLYINPGEVCARDTRECQAVLLDYNISKNIYKIHHLSHAINKDSYWEEESWQVDIACREFSRLK